MVEAGNGLRLLVVTEGDPQRRTGGSLYQQRMARLAPDHGVRLESVSVHPGIFAAQLAETRQLLGKLPRSDALLVDSIVAAAVAPWISAVARERPVIAVVHQQPGGIDRPWFSRLPELSLDLRTYRRASGVIAVSAWLADRLAGHGIHPNRITVVPPGRSARVSESLRPQRPTQVVAVSNWTANKNIHLILEAFAGLEAGQATLHLVGDPQIDPAYARHVRARIARRDLRDRVIAHGSLAPFQVERVLESSDIFVHAARHESYGSAVAEAMVVGLPVIAFAVDNLPYLIRDGREGLLVPFADIGWMGAALRSLLEDPMRRQAMGLAARERAARLPTWSESAQRFFSTIRRIIEAQAESRT